MDGISSRRSLILLDILLLPRKRKRKPNHKHKQLVGIGEEKTYLHSIVRLFRVCIDWIGSLVCCVVSFLPWILTSSYFPSSCPNNPYSHLQALFLSSFPPSTCKSRHDPNAGLNSREERSQASVQSDGAQSGYR
jgi:hypothetical protein